MNKLTLTVACTAGLMLLASCQSDPKFTLKGSDLPEDLNGKYVYMILDEDNRDSVLVENGAFTFTSSSVDETKLWHLISKDAQIQVPVIKEAGDFTLIKDETGKFVLDTPKDGKSLNATFAQFSKEMDTTLTPIAEEYRTKYQELSKEGLSEEETAQLKSEVEALQKKYMETSNGIARSYYEANKDNAVGATAFMQISFDKDEDFMAAYEQTSDVVKENEQLKKQYETLKISQETGEGKSYKGDYVIEDGVGGSAKLSDFKEEGKYLLVDFWASWCGPCRQAMPHLAGIVKDHSNTITVLSVGVWEKEKENNDKAREELGITWNAIYDKDSKSVDEYGILGIPTLLLVNPEGTIVYRGHDPEAVDAKIKELGL